MVITENNPVTIIRTDKLSRPTVTETNTPVLLQTGLEISKRLARTVLIFTESSDQLSRVTDRVPGLPASPGYVQ